MQVSIQLKIKENQSYREHLIKNSLWYKYLNRNPAYFREFEEEVKSVKNTQFKDRIVSALNTLEQLEKIASSLK